MPDQAYFWSGPAAARGVSVWAHGLGSLNNGAARMDARGTQPQGHVRAFNNAGFDVVRFDRDPNADDPNADDRERAAGWLRDSLAELRRRGYPVIVAGGQSRGGWNSLQALTQPGLAAVVIVVAAAAHGSGGSTNWSAQSDDPRRLVGAVPASALRLVFVQFQDDLFSGDLPDRQATIERPRGRLGAVLMIDRPEGLSGHSAGNSSAFANRFGPCLLQFAKAPVAPDAC